VRAWLRRGAAAAALASDRSDLWPAASLAALAYLGWLPLLLAVAPPQVPDVAQLAVQVASASLFPVNVVILCGALVLGFMLLCLLAALGEVAIVDRLRRVQGASRERRQSTLVALAVILVASVPASVAVAWLLVAAVGVAPAVYAAPGSADSVPARLAALLVPQLAAVVVAVLAGQAIGGIALRRALLAATNGAGDTSIASLRGGLRLLARRPWPWLGVAAVGWLKDAALLGVSWGLLSILWRPIGEAIGPGLLGSPQVLVLLVGFVAIWLSLLLAAGALHAFVSAWWLAEWRTMDER
jgi:hypothetical protein